MAFDLFGTKRVAASTGNQIDSTVDSLRNTVQTTIDSANEFNLLENKLARIAQLVQSEPTLVLMLDDLKDSIDVTQKKVLRNLNNIDSGLAKIDLMTNAIQQ